MMNNNTSDQLDYSKYFLHIKNPLIADLILLSTILMVILVAILLKKRLMSRRIKTSFLIISFLLGAIVFGGFPNVIFLEGLTFLFLGLTLIFGRIFCGYICPLGVAQELVSLIKFNSNFTNDLKTNTKYLTIIRWVVFCSFWTSIIILGVEIVPYLNPINGFLLIWFPSNLALIFPAMTLGIIVIASFYSYRPFCRYICPFGALASIISRFSIFKIRKTSNCIGCTSCKNTCPTGYISSNAKSGECYFCNRCVEFCETLNSIDSQKIANIKKTLSVLSLGFNDLPKEKAFESILKQVIKLFNHNNQNENRKNLRNALIGKSNFPEISVQKTIKRLRELFPQEIQDLSLENYKKMWTNNQSFKEEFVESQKYSNMLYATSRSIS